MTQPDLDVRAPSGSLSQLRVLVVDDQSNALKIIRDMLMTVGVQGALTAQGGNEALGIVKDKGAALDVILCDWTMPEMSGLEFLRLVRQMNRDIPFVMVTGTADPSSVLTAKDAGVTGYLKKPFSHEDLRKKLAAVARLKDFRD